jgi:hypothetical protein
MPDFERRSEILLKGKVQVNELCFIENSTWILRLAT